MIEEHFCVSKEEYQCFWITKDNVAEFVDKYLYLDEHTITITEQFACVKYVNYKYFTVRIKLNAFMVREQGDWTAYTKKEFDEMYEIIL